MIFYSRNIALSIIGLFGLLGVMLLSLIVILPIAEAQEKSKSFIAEVSFSSASGDYDYQSTTTSYSLGFDKAWGGEFFKTRFFTIFTGTDYDLQLTQNLAQKDYDKIESFDFGNINLVVDDAQKISRPYKTTRQVQDIEESLLEIGAGNNIKFVAGRIKNDWGVFNNDNPSLSLFPRRQVAAHEFLSNDRDAILAQDQLQFHLTSGIFTFEYYNFASARTDEDFEKQQRERLVLGTYYTEIIDDHNPDTPGLQKVEFRVEGSKAPRFPRTAAAPEYYLNYDDSPYTTASEAFRVSVKPIWGEFAFTHHVGRDVSRALLFSSFNLLVNFDERPNIPTVFTNIPLYSKDAPAQDGVIITPKNADYIFYPEAIMDSFEVDVPFGKKTRWRFESARFETIEGLGDNGRMFLNVNNSALGDDDNPEASQKVAAETLSRIFKLISDPNRDDEVKGSILYRAVKRTTAMGIDYQGKTYQGELNLIHTSAPAPISETDAEIIRLFQYFEQRANKKSYQILSNFKPKTQVTGKIIHKFGAEKQHEAGLVFDHILGRKGQGGFYTHNFKSNIALSIFAGTVTLEDIGTGEAYVNGEADKDTAILQTNINWKF